MQKTKQIAVYLNEADAEAFKTFRQYQSHWERLFHSEFTGSLTIHKARNNPEIVFEWTTRKKEVIHILT